AAAAPAGAAERVKLDALYIGAHPDDETFAIPSFGQWGEYSGIKSGVLTITRGEGGGNAIGPEEGPALGLLREAEERRAVGHSGVSDIFYLDAVDFYYTVSAPLTEELWGRRKSLAQVVRIIRQTRPEVILTMNPSPTPGNHGNHQYAARLAVEGFYAAADPTRFPKQITKEGLEPWTVKRVLQQALALVGPDAAVQTLAAQSPVTPPRTSEEECARAGGVLPTDVVYNVWRGRMSQRNGRPWAAVGAQAANEYASQGFSGPIAIAIGGLFFAFCDQYVEIATRVPDHQPAPGDDALFTGATKPAPGGLPLGSLFYVSPERFRVIPGVPFAVRVHARSGKGDLGPATAKLVAPDGWTVTAGKPLGRLTARRTRATVFTLTPPAAAQPGRVRLHATLTAGRVTASTLGTVEVVPAVSGSLAALPHVAEFRAWAAKVAPQLDALITNRQAIGVGERRELAVTLTNNGARTERGSVTIKPPDGFSAEPARVDYAKLKPGRTRNLRFRVTNTDPSLPTSADGGDYGVDITTTSSTGESTQVGALNLVPVTKVPAAAPTLDGAEEPGEYPGDALDVSRQWEGLVPPLTAGDASASAKVARSGDDLYVVVHVTDNLRGAVLPPADCKRHWRTDSVELTIDPQADSENTSTTFKSGIFPSTDDPANGNPPCFERDADNHQGPGPETAPGMAVASTVSSPYRGYTIEARIPMAVLPAAVDPQRMGLNVLVYDSDTQDKTGLHRLGWSTWGGVQGDPYRWGHAQLEGYQPPAGRPATAPKPTVPDTAVQSVASPQSLLQAVATGVAPGAHPAARPHRSAELRTVTLQGNELRVRLRARAAGTAHLFAWTGDRAAASAEEAFTRRGTRTVSWTLDEAARAAIAEDGVVLLGFANRRGAVAAAALTPTTPG
ncbi:MAG TPA: sugar-binding protein, partial [Solirubrobacteraceae bacterium]|nr:sugar-binding protein [Solirubrobacteraceae bacterium]